MIIKKAVDAFLERPRRDFRACLKWEAAEIEEAVAKLPTRPPYFDRLRRSQQICVAIGAHVRRFGYYNDMGTGKSFIAMALAAYFHEAEGARRFLILVPNRVNIRGWMDQCAKHAPDLKVTAMPSKIPDKLHTLMHDKSLLVIETYAGFSRLCSNANGNGKLSADPKLLAQVAGLLDGMVLDESSAIGHHASLQTEIVHRVAKLNPKMCVFLLSGTPFGRDPHLLWSQMRILDGGYTLGETLRLFRAAFFSSKQNYWGGWEHLFLQKKVKLLHRHIAHRAIRFPLDQADLPAVTAITVPLDLPADANKLYATAVAQIRASKGSYELCKHSFIKMRQISSGFVNLRDPDTGEREKLEFRENPKLEWVKSQIEGMDGQVIIFHDFIHSGAMLKRALDELGVSNTIINGQISGGAVNAAYDDFTQGKVQVLLLNSQAGAYGVNLQMAKYGVFYESPVPVIVRKQTELRFIRPGSEHQKVVKIDLVVNGTVDADILAFHAHGENLFQAILNGRHKV